MMENKVYKVELTPLGSYYFGSENTFKSSDKGDESKTSVNYLVRSRMYPQQTTLLGLIRYVLLLKENALQETSDKKGSLIGYKSFQGIEDNAPEEWGDIVSISPLFLQNLNEKFIIAGNDFQYYTNANHQENLVELIPGSRKGDLVTYSKYPFSLFTNYDAKQHSTTLWRNINDDKDFLKSEQVFIESFQVGITKSFHGNSNNDAFYKQYFYRLNRDFSFGFYLTMKREVKEFNESIVIPVGADQSLFRIKFTEESNTFLKNNSCDGHAKITLISDAYCNSGILDYCYLTITNSVDFRYIKTNVNTKRYYNLSMREDDMQKSAKLNLLERGTVLYTENADEIIKELKKYKAYLNAGFNYYNITQL